MKVAVLLGALLLAPFLFHGDAHADRRCRPVEIASLGGSVTVVHAINNRGQAVGRSLTTGDLAQHAFLWERGRTRDLGVLPGGRDSEARGINDSGVIAGTASAVFGANFVPVIWREGQIEALRLPEGVTNGTAVDVNEAGQIVGNAEFSRCLIWQDSDAEPLEVPALGGDYCELTGINDRGEVAGFAETVDGHLIAFVWQDGERQLLEASTALPNTIALDIDERGQVAGHAYEIGVFNSRPVRWSSDGDPTVFDIADARGTSLNDRGDMAVFAHVGESDGALRLVDRHDRVHDFGALGGTPFQPDFYLNDRREAVFTRFDGRILSFSCKL